MSKKKESKAPPPEPEPQPQLSAADLRGFSRFEYQEGTFYQGNWVLKDSKKVKQGYGKLVVNAASINPQEHQYYIGNWVDDQMEGSGSYYYSSGALYEGEWRKGKQHGQGIYYFTNGAVYRGQWEEHKMHGEGEFTDSQGRIFKSFFVQGQFKSKNQNQLLKKKLYQVREKNIIESTRHIFKDASADNITSFVEKLIPSSQQLHQYCRVKIKLEDHKPAEWLQALTQLQQEEPKPLLNIGMSHLVKAEAIQKEQMGGLGQIVEFKGSKYSLVICEMQKGVWKIVFVEKIR